MSAFFRKASPRIPVALSSGAFVKFDQIDLNNGVFKTDDPAVITGLTALIGSGRGGVTGLTEEEYEEFLKKKSTLANSSKTFSQINEVQTAGLIIPRPAVPPPPTPPLPTRSEIVAPVVISPKPLTEPPPIKLGKT